MLEFQPKKQSSILENQINTLLQYANSNGFEIDKVYKVLHLVFLLIEVNLKHF